MSDGGRSIANSEGSEATTGGSRRRRRSTRSSTNFQLAHPAPTLTQRQKLLHIRPKLIFQIQRLATNVRPRPELDVLPNTVVVPRVLHNFPRLFRGKTSLGVNDVVVVKSEDYDAPDSRSAEVSESDEEGLKHRPVLAVICQLRKDSGGLQGKAEITLLDSVWIATPLPNNRYEFVSVNEQGNQTTARWVYRGSKNSSDMTAVGNPDYRFTFSIIDPNTRRHPILATLTQTTLSIPDQYTTVSSSAGRYPPTSPMHSLQDDTSGDDGPTLQRSTHLVDDDLRTLIQMTGIWVALREGWSPYFKYNATAPTCASPSPSPQLPSNGRVHSLSATPDGSKGSSFDSTPESGRSNLGSVSSKLRRSYSKASPAITNSSFFENPNGPRRAVSVGTAFMQRVEARREKATAPSTIISDSDGEAIFSRRSSVTIRAAPGGPPTTPQPNAPNLGIANLDTPTRPQRRVQSAYIPTGSFAADRDYLPQRHSLDRSNPPPITANNNTPKISRWKAFTNIFRRSRSV